MNVSQKSSYSAPALEKGLDILEYLAGERFSNSQVDIAKALGRSQGEIYRMLACLEERGYVLKEPNTGNYRLSLRLYQLAHRQSSTMLLRHAAMLPLDALADETGQSCHLSVQQGGGLVVLMERMPRQHVCLAVGEGTALPLSQSASGKVLLSRMPEEVAQQALENEKLYGSSSTGTRKSLLKSLDSIRVQGYLITESAAQTESVTDIAVPVGVANTDTSAVVTVPFISRPGTVAKSSKPYLKSVLKCANRINRNLGISP